LRASFPGTRRRRLIRPGTLWPTLLDQTRAAEDAGALQPIETVQRFVEDGGVRFLIRQVSSLARKFLEQTAGGLKPANPFLPFDEMMFVADVSDTHVALLNKFNVIPRHLLIVTRRFEDQELALTAADFKALWTCMAEFDALGFYNGGAEAGASQPHKHLQMVPLPLAPPASGVPMESLLEKATGPGISTVPGLPFAHAFCRLPAGTLRDPGAAAAQSQRLYLELLAATGIAPVASTDGLRQSAPYNFLVTRDWMLLVPRSREHFGSISLNALGYAGSFFVRDEAQMESVISAGPMGVLEAVGVRRKSG